MCSNGTRDAVSRSRHFAGTFSDRTKITTIRHPPIRSPRAPPLHARTDHDRRSTGSFPPGGHRRSDLHTGGIDTPPQAVHRAPRLHRARVRRQRIQASAHRTWFPIRHFSRRFRRRRHRDGRARGVQTRVWEPDRCTQGRCTRRRHHRDAEAGNRPGPRGRRAPDRAGLGCYGCVDCETPARGSRSCSVRGRARSPSAPTPPRDALRHREDPRAPQRRPRGTPRHRRVRRRARGRVSAHHRRRAPARA